MIAGGDDPSFEVAIEHCAWAIRTGQRPHDIFAALGIPTPQRPTWNAAIWAVALAYEDLPLTADHRQGVLQLVA